MGSRAPRTSAKKRPPKGANAPSSALAPQDRPKRGAPKGNQNSAQPGIWRRALVQAIAEAGGSRYDQLQATVQLAKKLLTVAKKGNVPALKEIGDRLDGKALQTIGGPDGGPIQTSITSPIQVYLPANGRDAAPGTDTPPPLPEESKT